MNKAAAATELIQIILGGSHNGSSCIALGERLASLETRAELVENQLLITGAAAVRQTEPRAEVPSSLLPRYTTLKPASISDVAMAEPPAERLCHVIRGAEEGGEGGRLGQRRSVVVTDHTQFDMPTRLTLAAAVSACPLACRC